MFATLIEGTGANKYPLNTMARSARRETPHNINILCEYEHVTSEVALIDVTSFFP